MPGAALGKLWGTNPKLACLFQTLISLMLAVFLVMFMLQRNWMLSVIVAIGLALEAGTLIWFTRDAIQHGWAKSDY